MSAVLVYWLLKGASVCFDIHEVHSTACPISLHLMWFPLPITLSTKNNTTVLTALSYCKFRSFPYACCDASLVQLLLTRQFQPSSLYLYPLTPRTHFFTHKSLPLMTKTKGKCECLSFSNEFCFKNKYNWWRFLDGFTWCWKTRVLNTAITFKLWESILEELG